MGMTVRALYGKPSHRGRGEILKTNVLLTFNEVEILYLTRTDYDNWRSKTKETKK